MVLNHCTPCYLPQTGRPFVYSGRTDRLRGLYYGTCFNMYLHKTELYDD